MEKKNQEFVVMDKLDMLILVWIRDIVLVYLSTGLRNLLGRGLLVMGQE